MVSRPAQRKNKERPGADGEAVPAVCALGTTLRTPKSCLDWLLYEYLLTYYRR